MLRKSPTAKQRRTNLLSRTGDFKDFSSPNLGAGQFEEIYYGWLLCVLTVGACFSQRKSPHGLFFKLLGICLESEG